MKKILLSLVLVFACIAIRAAAITIDASVYAANYTGLQMQVVGFSSCVPASQSLSLNLNPGYYQLNFCGTGGNVFFYVQQNGSITYDPSYVGIGGANTSALHVSGTMVKIDASYYFAQHPNAQFRINGLTACINQSIQSFILVPGNYAVNFCAYQGNVNFSVNSNGTVNYNSDLAAMCSGAGTTSLIIRGYYISYNALNLPAGSQYQNVGLFGCVTSSVLRTELMVPGYYQLNKCNAVNYFFYVNDNGLVTIPSQFAFALTGTGTSTVKFISQNPLVADAGPCATVYAGYTPAACVTLNGTAAGGVAPYSFLWSNNVSGSSNYVCPSSTTTYTLTVTDATGTISTSQVTVYVENVTCGNCNNKVLICHIPPGNPNNPQTLCVAPSAVPAHLAHGDVLGSCSSINNCNGNRIAQPENDFVMEEQELLIYPNPASGSLQTHFATPVTGNAVITMYTPDGRVVYSNTTVASEGVHYDSQIDLTGFAPGIYFLELSTEAGVSTEKVVVE